MLFFEPENAPSSASDPRRSTSALHRCQPNSMALIQRKLFINDLLRLERHPQKQTFLCGTPATHISTIRVLGTVVGSHADNPASFALILKDATGQIEARVPLQISKLFATGLPSAGDLVEVVGRLQEGSAGECAPGPPAARSRWIETRAFYVLSDDPSRAASRRNAEINSLKTRYYGSEDVTSKRRAEGQGQASKQISKRARPSPRTPVRQGTRRTQHPAGTPSHFTPKPACSSNVNGLNPSNHTLSSSRAVYHAPQTPRTPRTPQTPYQHGFTPKPQTPNIAYTTPQGKRAAPVTPDHDSTMIKRPCPVPHTPPTPVTPATPHANSNSGFGHTHLPSPELTTPSPNSNDELRSTVLNHVSARGRAGLGITDLQSMVASPRPVVRATIDQLICEGFVYEKASKVFEL